jgi:hypothetical protein
MLCSRPSLLDPYRLVIANRMILVRSETQGNHATDIDVSWSLFVGRLNLLLLGICELCTSEYIDYVLAYVL